MRSWMTAVQACFSAHVIGRKSVALSPKRQRMFLSADYLLTCRYSKKPHALVRAENSKDPQILGP